MSRENQISLSSSKASIGTLPLLKLRRTELLYPQKPGVNSWAVYSAGQTCLPAVELPVVESTLVPYSDP